MRLYSCLSTSVFLHMLCLYYTYCMLIKIIEPTSVLFAKNNWFLFVISSRINKKLLVAKTKLVNNLICLKDGCLSSHSHFCLLLRGGYKRREVQTIVGFLHRGNSVFGFPTHNHPWNGQFDFVVWEASEVSKYGNF